MCLAVQTPLADLQQRVGDVDPSSQVSAIAASAARSTARSRALSGVARLATVPRSRRIDFRLRSGIIVLGSVQVFEFEQVSDAVKANLHVIDQPPPMPHDLGDGVRAFALIELGAGGSLHRLGNVHEPSLEVGPLLIHQAEVVAHSLGVIGHDAGDRVALVPCGSGSGAGLGFAVAVAFTMPVSLTVSLGFAAALAASSALAFSAM